MGLSPHRIARQRPRRADADEPVWFDAGDVIAQEDEEQAKTERHQAVDPHRVAERGRDDHRMRHQHEHDHGVADQPVGAQELGVVLAARIEFREHVVQSRHHEQDHGHNRDGQQPAGEPVRRAAQIPVRGDGRRQTRIGPDGDRHGHRGNHETKPAATHCLLPQSGS